jgi:hypothetical protein
MSCLIILAIFVALYKVIAALSQFVLSLLHALGKFPFSHGSYITRKNIGQKDSDFFGR